MTLNFPPRPIPPRPKKRRRAVADIDGEYSCLHKKKRRLRLFLITSRLSPQFSHPATNIVDRGSSKIAVWAKQKALGRNLLRKAAILNRIRKQVSSRPESEEGAESSPEEQEKEQHELELARLEFVYGSHDTHTRPVIRKNPSLPPGAAVRVGGYFEISGDPYPEVSPPKFVPHSPDENDGAAPSSYRSPNDAYASSYPPHRAQSPRRSYIPLPPSPLGLSNYAAFDQDEVYAHLDDDDRDNQSKNEDESTDSEYTAFQSASPFELAFGITTDPDDSSVAPSRQTIYSDFNILDPGQPVMGDYDQVDEGADAIWPTSSVLPSIEPTILQPASSSPNFSALLSHTSVLPPRPLTEPEEITGVLHEDQDDVKKEKERQRTLMSFSFSA